MEAKINIVEILKDKPQGTMLYSSACGKCKLEEVDDKSFKISFYNSKFGFMNGGEGYLDKNGKLYDDGECVIFPSKEMRNWSKFAWKKGDVLVSNDGKERVIFEKFQDNRYLRFFGKFFSQRKEDGDIDYKFALDAPTNNYTLEDKDVAQIYINTIEERLGGKLNRQTLEVEKALPEFKDGDIVFADFGNTQDIFIVSGKTNLSEGYYSFIVLNLNSTKALSLGYKTSFFKENLNTIRLATEEEKKQLFDALEKEGKAWDAEKKQIVDLKPNIELKPFDKVLVRDFSRDKWSISFFSFKKEDCYVCINHCSWNQCIPYIGNESLLGTTKDVEG